jgi:hypothetical protein
MRFRTVHEAHGIIGRDEKDRVPIGILYDPDLTPLNALLNGGARMQDRHRFRFDPSQRDGFRDPHNVS